jgi:putative peptidoglycan lipid II flippase
LGLAVATAIFPLLSRHAARGDREQLGSDLTLGCRLVLFLGVPASAGLMLLAGPIAELLFERGQFTSADTVRAARMIAVYGSGVWAYCALPVVIRGFYALGDRTTPMKIGAMVVLCNLAMNLLLVWPLAEAGLALATSLTASLQVLLLMAVFSRRKSHLGWRAMAATAARTTAATGLMMAAGLTSLTLLPSSEGLVSELARVVLPSAVSVLVYFAVIASVGGTELKMLRGMETCR